MKPIGHTIIRLDEVESTSTLMLEDSAYLENHGLVVIARHQTGGRGRMGRRWASLPGGQLQFSLVLHPNLPPQEVPLLSLVSGLAVARALEDVLALRPALKWPNDVLLGGGKVYFVGNALVDLFLQSRNWPFGSAVAIALVVIMLVAIALYLAAVGRERTRSDTSLV